MPRFLKTAIITSRQALNHHPAANQVVGSADTEVLLMVFGMDYYIDCTDKSQLSVHSSGTQRPSARHGNHHEHAASILTRLS